MYRPISGGSQKRARQPPGPNSQCVISAALPCTRSPPALPQYRWHVFKSIRAAIDANEGGLDKFTRGGWLGWL